jgi:hypothetical protein
MRIASPKAQEVRTIEVKQPAGGPTSSSLEIAKPEERLMTLRIRRATAAAVLTLLSSALLSACPALAQGPYGRNSYADFPYNQGSLFYRPLKPEPRPKKPVYKRVAPAAPAPATGYSTTQPRYVVPQQPRYYYYYPAYPR